MQLAGKVLIAMPGMEDPRFAQSVVLICAHGPDSAMGLIINKPSQEMDFSNLLRHLGIARTTSARSVGVHYGGPVERGRGFVLHSSDWPTAAEVSAAPDAADPPDPGAKSSADDPGETSTLLPGGLRLTATQSILEALARGAGPARALVALGYAGWGPGQLESEILRNDWLTGEVGLDLIFDPDDSGKWARAMREQGIDPLTLSPVAGRA
ncbi:YqgE/AlgH family protein [Xinfangfangia sp. D13-10-4-6]|uniref:YqgE/AlgH family protein n=1 Tax=Pseudogemmobacter hezensis TaxID=2737662 RepID=UPI001557ABAD|nr:YqgE/AlgH family protein [Pseudogemmobacter hezensis]NPD17077.1 YqgE/AlgH family protein [Pseudogemmobacter hezensis]